MPLGVGFPVALKNDTHHGRQSGRNPTASPLTPADIGNLLQAHAKDRLSNALRVRVGLKRTSDYLPLAKTCFRAARQNGRDRQKLPTGVATTTSKEHHVFLRSQCRRHIPCAVHRIPVRITVSRTAHRVCLQLLSDTTNRASGDLWRPQKSKRAVE